MSLRILNELMWCRLFRRLMPEMGALSPSETTQVVRRTLQTIRCRWYYIFMFLVELAILVVLAMLVVVPAITGSAFRPGRLILGMLISFIGGLGADVWNLYWLFRPEVQRTLREEINRLQRVVCIHCGYDLRGQADPRCPECGTWSLDAAVHLEKQQAVRRKDHGMNAVSKGELDDT